MSSVYSLPFHPSSIAIRLSGVRKGQEWGELMENRGRDPLKERLLSKRAGKGEVKFFGRAVLIKAELANQKRGAAIFRNRKGALRGGM